MKDTTQVEIVKLTIKTYRPKLSSNIKVKSLDCTTFCYFVSTKYFVPISVYPCLHLSVFTVYS